MQFRQKALAKQQSPEELDIPVRLARPQGRLVLAAVAAVSAAACVWAVLGSVTATLSAAGVLTHAEGGYTLQSPVAGQVTAVRAAAGDTVAGGAPLLTVQQADQRSRTVRVPDAGRLTALDVGTGAVVAVGEDLASVERIRSAADPLYAVLYVSASSGAGIPVGAPVDVTVQAVPAARYGVLRGRVAGVGRDPQTRQQIAGFLGDAALAAHFAAQGPSVAVLVRLERAATRSGYRWSTAEGPPFPMQSGLLVGASVHVSTQHPVDWLLP